MLRDREIPKLPGGRIHMTLNGIPFHSEKEVLYEFKAPSTNRPFRSPMPISRKED